MQKSIASILEPLAERCVALAASMLATTVETLHIKYQAEQQNRLEELARTYEQDGMPEVANALRERLRTFANDKPTECSEFLFRQLRQLSEPGVQEDTVGGNQSFSDGDPRRTAKPRRARRVCLPDPAVTDLPGVNTSLPPCNTGFAANEETQ